ncbi:MAG: hypothetical protein HOP34_12740 [Methylococcaceae bacterium]|nr:hypothetical protein [Methylococcaceae bacterium]
MLLYVWTKPAFLNGLPVDHTWVTSYSYNTNYPDIIAVINANEHFWYCCGDFYPTSNSTKSILKITSSSGVATCLVGSNNDKAYGTIRGRFQLWKGYGIDGVCHQVSNQVLYPYPSYLSFYKKVKGYRVSSAFYGTYGRQEDEWYNARQRCNVAPKTRRPSYSLLVKRLKRILRIFLNHPFATELELRRRNRLSNLDKIAFAIRTQDETAETRVSKMNKEINLFLKDAADLSVGDVRFDDDSFFKMFGVKLGEEIFLIDPSLFEFPPTSDIPERNALLGW